MNSCLKALHLSSSRAVVRWLIRTQKRQRSKPPSARSPFLECSGLSSSWVSPEETLDLHGKITPIKGSRPRPGPQSSPSPPSSKNNSARPLFLPAAGSGQGLSKKKEKEKALLPVSLVLDTDGQGLPTQMPQISCPLWPGCCERGKTGCCWPWLENRETGQLSVGLWPLEPRERHSLILPVFLPSPQSKGRCFRDALVF